MGTLNPRGPLCVIKSDGKCTRPASCFEKLLPSCIHSFIYLENSNNIYYQLLGAVGCTEVKISVLGASVCDTGILTLIYINMALMIMVLV